MPPKIEGEGSAGMSELAHKISKLTMANFAKPKSYVYGDDFRQFCVKFKRYVELNEIERPNLYLVFLSMLDNRTDEILNGIELTADQMKSADEFFKL